MKRDGWSVKRLGEVCEILNGRNQKKVEDINGKYPIYGSGGIMGYANDYICRAGTTIIGRKGSINKPLYVDKDFWNVDTAFGLQPKDCCHSRFLYYLCKSIDFTRYDKGVTIPSLVKSDLLQIPVSLPPLPEQSLIIEELDRLSSILEKKRQQLSDLDNLAQSIFYEMFGDPVRNEKGWEVKRLGEMAKSIFAGGDKPKDYSEVMNGIYCYPIIANGDGDKGVLGYAKSYKVGEKAVTLGARGASIGNCRICEAYFTPIVRLITIIPDVYVNIVFLYYNIKRLSFNVSGAGQAQLTVPNVVNKQTILPPLPLQQLFAQKVEAIEQEKVLIKQSIKEVQELLDSRMEEYFGGS